MDATGACNSRGTRETGEREGGLRYESYLDKKKRKEKKTKRRGKRRKQKGKKGLTPGIVPTGFWV